MAILIHKPNKNDLNELKQLFEDGKIVSVIDRTFALNETAEAVRYFSEGHAKGKVVIRVVE